MKNAFFPKTIQYTLVIIFLVVLLLSLFPQITQAINLDDVKKAAEDGGLNTKYDSFYKIFLAFLQGILALSFITAVIFVVISGLRMMASRGNEEQLAAAKKAFLWAIIGIVVISLSWFIVVRITNIVTSSAPG